MEKIEEKRKKWAEEIKKFINDNNMDDVFVSYNEFKEFYNCDLYIYLRVSTEKQDFGRQLIELYEWAKKHNITIYINNIYFDKYTGKRTTRSGYQTLKRQLKSNDYIITTNLNRLGRDWDEIKKEWYTMEANNIQRIILDNNLLSVELPNEEESEMTLNKKFMQLIGFGLALYGACQKIEEVTSTTKGGLEKAAKKGHYPGRPAGKHSTIDNFIKTLRLIAEDGKTTREAFKITKIPNQTYFYWLKKYKKDFNVDNTKDLYNILKFKI